MIDPKLGVPEAGSFPGFSMGLKLVNAWANALNQQAMIWNDAWSQIKGGNYEIKNWFQTIAKSIEVSSESIEQIYLSMSGPLAPPWVSIPYKSPEPVVVKLRKPIDERHKLRVTKFALLGGPDSEAISVELEPVGPYSVQLTLTPPKKEPGVGTHIGILFSDKYEDALAVVAIIVPE